MVWFSWISLFPSVGGVVNFNSTNCTTGLRIEESHSQVYECHTFAIWPGSWSPAKSTHFGVKITLKHHHCERNLWVESQNVMECLIWEKQGCEWRLRLPAETRTSYSEQVFSVTVSGPRTPSSLFAGPAERFTDPILKVGHYELVLEISRLNRCLNNSKLWKEKCCHTDILLCPTLPGKR